MTFEKPETILIEIEAVLNSRPLTYSRDELITLSMFVTGKLSLNTSNDVLSDVTIADENTDTLNRRSEYLHKLLSYFRGRWRRENPTIQYGLHYSMGGGGGIMAPLLTSLFPAQSR